jgi:hypothetical protein
MTWKKEREANDSRKSTAHWLIFVARLHFSEEILPSDNTSLAGSDSLIGL